MHHSHDKANLHQCPACDYGPFTRNNYFTGKLLVERDFTDEQRYYVDKLRHHNQRLHGWGVVCGLKVRQHSNEACRDRFVTIEPGTAIDCCGHEIILREEQHFDFTQTDWFKDLKKADDKQPHRLQVRICYRECPTEEIPVLYDECGCDDTQCAPNRILESYALEVAVDPPKNQSSIFAPRFESEYPINVAHSFRVAFHEATSRLYVMTADQPGAIYPVSTDNQAVLPSRALPAKGLALAVSNDGTRLYVVTEAESNPSTSKRQLLVFDTANLSAASALIRSLDIDNSVGSDISLAVAPQPDGRLFVLISKTGIVRMFSSGINTAAGSPSPGNTPALGANLTSLVIGTDGTLAYVADPANRTLLAINVATATLDSTINVLPANCAISAVEVLPGAGDMLAVADSFNKAVHLVGLAPARLIGSSAALAHEPFALAVSSGGQWVYVLERDLTKNYLQAVSANSIQLASPGQPVNPEPELELRVGSQQLVITESGEYLYIPFTGDLTVTNDGGVAILKIDERQCSEILWRHLEGCPQCDQPNCVVLGTIESYRVGDKLLDPVDPPSDPLADDAANIARIDNRKGRKLLPSTEVLTDLMECLLEHPAGGAAKQGPVGPQGPSGTSVTSVDAVTVAPTQPASATFDAVTGNIHFEIPAGAPGEGGGGVKSADAVTVAPTQPASAIFDAVSGNIHFEIPKGAEGLQGQPGKGVDSVDAVSVPPTQAASATFDPATGHIHFEIPKGEKGATGGASGGLGEVSVQIVNCGLPPSATIVQVAGKQNLELVIPSGCDTDLTHICAINWLHNKKATASASNQIKNNGLLIAFDREVVNGDINPQTFLVLTAHNNEQTGLTCWCEVPPKRVGGVKLSDFCKAVNPESISDPAAFVNGAQFIPGRAFRPDALYRVVLKGNFIRDSKGKAVDADHLPNWLPGQESGDGVEGGTFESWFTFGGQ